MQLVRNSNDPIVVGALVRGGVVVLRTDTIYGLIACANNEQAVERIYRIKNRNPSKPCIILLDQPSMAYGHGEELDQDNRLHGQDHPTSFLIEAAKAPVWLLRQNHELAYRVPHHAGLQQLIAQTGPLIAPSANPEGIAPARTATEAMDYFGDAVDVYVDGGEVPINMLPSRLVRVHPDGTQERLR